MRVLVDPYVIRTRCSGKLQREWLDSLTFWHSSMMQSHRSSPHREKYFSAKLTIFWIDCWDLEAKVSMGGAI